MEDALTAWNSETTPARVHGLSRNPALPDPLVLRILDHPAAAMSDILYGRELSDELFGILAAHPDVRLREVLARSGGVTPDQRARLIDDPSSSVVFTLLEWPGVLPAWGYRKLAAHPKVKRRLPLYLPIELPRAVVAAFAEVDDEEIAAWARPKPDPEPQAEPEPKTADQYRTIATGESAWERARIAMDPALPADLITTLAADPEPHVRQYLSMRPGLSEEQRAAIDYEVSTDDRLPVLGWVLEARGDQLQRCVSSAHPGIRRSAACHPELTADQIAALAADDDFPVRLLLCENHDAVPADLVVRTFLEARVITRGNLLSHPAMAGADLTRYADSPYWGARALVVRDPHAPPELIDRLSRDEHPGVRYWMASDPRLSQQRVLELFDDPEVTGSAAANPKLPVELMVAILDAPLDTEDPPQDQILVMGHTMPTHEPVGEV
ncbi:hypothetical protein [Actinoplanes couchii]|uniref:hypothetical protein n=1 Tax=Actinoplanes couchii TaxID=403638 RepID=UPI001943B20F|nr:hypothetical protein [Actinoplanes couchii]MDR6317670.1 hypothetical protein [Actinoplanes couchii]